MPYYKQPEFFIADASAAFDEIHSVPPGSLAPFAGIYRCTGCGHEIAIAKGHVMPPQNHHQHTIFHGPIQWQLVAAAIEKNKP